MATGSDEFRLFSFQEISDIVATPSTTVRSTESQTVETTDDPNKALVCKLICF
jgi:hypothetical protein